MGPTYESRYGAVLYYWNKAAPVHMIYIKFEGLNFEFSLFLFQLLLFFKYVMDGGKSNPYYTLRDLNIFNTSTCKPTVMNKVYSHDQRLQNQMNKYNYMLREPLSANAYNILFRWSVCQLQRQ